MSAHEESRPALAWTLEVVRLPVTDLDRAKTFYAEQLGFVVDHDVKPAPGVRIVQLTPPGSSCSVLLSEGTGAPDASPGSVEGLQLVVSDVAEARHHLAARGVEVSDVQSVDGDAEKVSAGGTTLDDVGFVFFHDPDGNGWAVQQISTRPRLP